jgi:hypothetical protein
LDLQAAAVELLQLVVRNQQAGVDQAEQVQPHQ